MFDTNGLSKALALWRTLRLSSASFRFFVTTDSISALAWQILFPASLRIKPIDLHSNRTPESMVAWFFTR